MIPTEPHECPLHGAGANPDRLTGRRVQQVVAAWHRHDSEDAAGPLEIWLVDELGGYFHITTGSDWCLITDEEAPHAGYDLGESSRVEVVSSERGTPFADYLGEVILAVDQRFDARTGRVGLKVCFATGTVECGSWGGDLQVTG
ncbi:hypothetical protein EDD90_2225 [Streptomyces sp. Ag109_O5-1]|uniref:hypothetical protein n=1 Tax=Streptomyces sp. Ag109_O5-1 TaxID=1938851 RepID=UPI000F50E219|nr:hypothetical protein [Streptomyces sp. Ag109_O5-1]RPE38919.1 hypothetical protein EDD90_1860 [Streptomyces sp. Ag109_O5-1]RPE38948.1 hypothetical protein EDD90_1894 [Streptomyces sp. Ag109_O5-1]RPE39019.1 hypothetical protein EDD90_1972 [Streptomyces sp. Ag109_O5-1]RPE39022.1 hypothetical protein EDD90_1976 [Streptomyces sp. Ag109_O5-1]RPE39238.1 hypothetical protein EDD90_2225 [Streptomyces sp. Ag109_O5-1]